MAPRISKVIALSRKPLPQVVPGTRDTVPLKDTVPHEKEIRDTVSSKDPVSLQGTVSLKVYRCAAAQDGHSFAEDRLYNALWNAPQTRTESDDTRIITIGWDVMAKLAKMTPRNVKENCQRLLSKLALEKVQGPSSEQRIGTTYRIYSFRAIVNRRRESGMEWVVRNRGGVTFVSPPGPTHEKLRSIGGTVSLKPPTTRDTVPSQGPVSVSSQGRDTVPSEDTLLDNIEVRESQTSSSQRASSLELSTLGLNLDDDAWRRLVRQCRNADPEATDAEIFHFLRLKAAQLKNKRNVGNLVGLLLSAVPIYFVPPASELMHYRRQIATAPPPEAEARESREVAEAILADPTEPETMKQHARDVLRELNARGPASEGS